MTAPAPLTVVAPRRSLPAHVTGVWRYRELLAGLVRKELKVKYKNSALGFLWSLANPAMYLLVFYVVFQLVLENGIERFALYLLAGLLVWNLFSASLASATSAIVANGPLVNKVWFPREILPLASVGANLVHCLDLGQFQKLPIILVGVEHRAGGGPAHPPAPAGLGVRLAAAARARRAPAAGVGLRRAARRRQRLRP